MSMHIRKQRLQEALQHNLLNGTTIDPSKVESGAGVRPKLALPKELPNALADNMKDDRLVCRDLQRKLLILEKWEEVKRRAVEHFSIETEHLLSLQDHIEKEERRLQELQAQAGGTPKRMRPMDWHYATRPCTPFSTDGSSSGVSDDSGIVKRRKTSTDSEESVMGDHVVIGPNGTTIPRRAFNNINWNLSGPAVTRKILMEVFDRDTLAFHTLTGKPSPAFMGCGKPMKNQLDPAKVADIMHIMVERMGMTAKEVRSAITTKCADENKMFRQRQQKLANIAATPEVMPGRLRYLGN